MPIPPCEPKIRMNKTEAAYAHHLHLLKQTGEILAYRFEPIKFRLADRTYYTPDFEVIRPEQIEFHEVKGFWRDDARVKIKVAAEMYQEFAWCAVKKTKQGWDYEWF